MAKQKNLDLVNDEGRTDLHVASAMNNIHSVYLLLESGANPDQADLYGDTPLHYACFNRNIDSQT